MSYKKKIFRVFLYNLLALAAERMSSFSSDGSSSSTGDSSHEDAVIVVIVLVVLAVKFIVIARLYIYWKKKVQDMLPTHAQAQPTNHAFPLKRGFQVEAATMEKFLSDIAREKPIRFSPQQLFGFTQNYSTVLGSGGFGVVYKGELPNGVLIAVKVLNNSSGKRMEEQFMAEVGTIGRTYHINLVRLYGFCFDPVMRALVYEYMENGSLDHFLFGNESKAIEYRKLHEIAIGTAKGIAYLHEECQKRIIHYDIKPGNVLLGPNMNPKVADFGLAKLCSRDNTHVIMSGCRGTPGYAAPELWTPYPVTHKCDVYSFGMLLFEVVSRRRNHIADISAESQEWLPRWAYEKLKRKELAEMISAYGITSAEDSDKAERMVMVALWCVQYLPTARPAMSSVVKMLEGGIEIIQPPNPFDYLEDHSIDMESMKSSTVSGSSGEIHEVF
ncbi:hypothetical protein Dimus_029714 [Dionaea muscipula]